MIHEQVCMNWNIEYHKATGPHSVCFSFWLKHLQIIMSTDNDAYYKLAWHLPDQIQRFLAANAGESLDMDKFA